MLIGKIRSPERRVMKLISLLIIALVLLCLGSMAEADSFTYKWDKPLNTDGSEYTDHKESIILLGDSNGLSTTEIVVGEVFEYVSPVFYPCFSAQVFNVSGLSGGASDIYCAKIPNKPTGLNIEVQ